MAVPGKISIIEVTFTTISTQLETEDEDNIRESLELFKELIEPIKEYLGVLEDIC